MSLSLFLDPYYWMLVGAVTQFKSLPEPTQDFTGKKIIITGGNGGLGREAARTFVKLGAATVVIACRDLDSAEEAKTDIETTTGRKGVVKVWQLDLKSFDSVKELCRRAERELDRLDCLVENAAVLSFSREMAEGHESSVTVNVISPMLMVFMLLPLMRRTAVQFNVVPHVTTMSSDAHLGAKFPERSQPNIFEALKSEGSYQLDKYSTTKLVNLFVNRQLAEQLGPDSSVIVNMVSPGLCKTRLFREMMFPFNYVFRMVELAVARTAEAGSRTLVHAASAGRESHGRYLEACGIRGEEQFLGGEEGRKTQKKLYGELRDILEGIQPGATKI